MQPGRGLPLQKLKRIAYGMIAGRQITRSNLYCSSDAVVKTVQAYMDYLSAEGILLKRPNQIYIKRQELTLPKSAESTAALDKQAVQNAFEFMSGI
ncbi:hypothetical protein [Bacillus marinisedimentorum]|uniref:hypothetical protein n=1 Tax=Bacillus marinisedimentorum TaxID=1821260 RepID=UPI001470C17F|nr:hypothetical protein [Bacillus marinisedimentorum]